MLVKPPNSKAFLYYLRLGDLYRIGCLSPGATVPPFHQMLLWVPCESLNNALSIHQFFIARFTEFLIPSKNGKPSDFFNTDIRQLFGTYRFELMMSEDAIAPISGIEVSNSIESTNIEEVPVYAAISLKLICQQKGINPESLVACTKTTYQAVCRASKSNTIEHVALWREMVLASLGHPIVDDYDIMANWPKADTAIYIGIDASVLQKFFNKQSPAQRQLPYS